MGDNMKLVNKTTEGGKVVKLKDYKKRVRRNRLKRKLLLVLLILLVIALILLYAPFMKIKNINSVGNEKVPCEEIIASSQIYKGNNIFRINKSKATKNIEDIPYIKSVSIDRILPSTISIIVEECQVCGYILDNKKIVYIDEGGKVLEVSDTIPEKTAAIINGVKLTKSNVNEVCEFKNKQKLQALTSIMSAIVNSRFNGLVTAIEISDVKKIVITVNDKLDIIIGDVENLDYKVNFMASGAYDSLGSNRSGILDVSYGSSAVYKEKQ